MTSGGENKNSCFFYMRIKGEVEENCKNIGINFLSILRPGLIKNRENERCGECCFKCILSGIQCEDLGRAQTVD